MGRGPSPCPRDLPWLKPWKAGQAWCFIIEVTGTIASYSPELLKPDRREAGSTKLGGGRCVLKREKLVPLTYKLRISSGDLMFFWSCGHKWSLFRAKTRPENAVGMLGTEVGALFRVIFVAVRFEKKGRLCVPKTVIWSLAINPTNPE